MIYENKVIYQFDANNKPIETIEAGETLIVEVSDVFNNQLSRTQEFENITFKRLNPATGPFYIYQAVPNTMLKVKILKTKLYEMGVGAIVKNLGILGGKIEKSKVFKHEITGNTIKIGEQTISLDPFISIIGVAPKEKSYPCGIPFNHGGKIDCPHLKSGNAIYLPVNVKGAYLALGGLKAAQGFGQLGGTGIECSGEIKLTVDVCNKFFLNIPLIITEKSVIFIYSGKTLDIALEKLSHEVTTLLVKSLKISFSEAYHYLSILGSLEVYQLVNPHITIGIAIPKEFISERELFQLES